MLAAVYQKLTTDIVLDKQRLCQILAFLSSLYVAIPNLLFQTYWLRLPFNLISIACTILLMAWGFHKLFARRSSISPSENSTLVISRGAVIVFVTMTVLWSVFSGVGGLGFSYGDILDGDAVIYDLCQNDWPLHIPIPPNSFAAKALESNQYHFVYYLGFYLPCAWVGRLFCRQEGYSLSCWVEMLWCLAGVLLSAFWFLYSIARKQSINIYALLGGLLVIIFFRANNSLFARFYQDFYHIFYWANPIALLYSAPQHTLSAWIAAGMCLAAWRGGIPVELLSLVLACCAIITPFTLIGAFPFLCFIAARHLRLYFRTSEFALSMLYHFLLFFLVFLPVALYLSSNSFSFPLLPWYKGEKFTWPLYGYALLVSIGLPALLLFLSRNKKQKKNTILWYGCICGTLFFSTLIRMGYWNDFPTRVSTIPLWLLAVELSLVFQQTKNEAVSMHLLRFAQVTILLFTLVGVSSYMATLSKQLHTLGIPPSSASHSFLEIPDKGTLLQRQGRPDSFFFRKLAR